jgi:hypothetical protein
VSILTSSIYNVSLIHRGDPNFNIACGIEGCYCTFRRFSSFTSHISRKHVFNKIQNVSIHNFVLSTLSKITTLSDLVGHLGTHIRNDESLICPHENCNTTMCIHLTVGWFLPELWSFMCLMGMVHFCVLCMQLVIYYLADFVHIWYNGWVWSEHVQLYRFSLSFYWRKIWENGDFII